MTAGLKMTRKLKKHNFGYCSVPEVTDTPFGVIL